MDVSDGASNVPAPFLTKTYEMVEDPVTDSVVSWSHSGRSFVVWNPPEFAKELLPKYFKHKNFSSFIRQLNTYGFRKIDPEQWEFANDEFLRGQVHLLRNIHRRKPIHSHSTQGSYVVPLSYSERQEFLGEIERLKQERDSLQSELERQEQEKLLFASEFGSLGQRVKTIGHRQRQLMAFLAQWLQKPELSCSEMHESETNNKKRRLCISNFLHNEANEEESELVTFQEEAPNMLAPILNLELADKLDSCINYWEKFMYGGCQTSPEEMYDFGVLPHPPTVVVTGMQASSGDSDMNMRPCSSSSPLRDIACSHEFADSSLHVDSPVISSLCINMDSMAKSSGTDLNSCPANVMDTDGSKDRPEGDNAASAPMGTNDVFWQQFLTESPGCDMDFRSERREMGPCMNDSRFTELHKPWWNNNSMNNNLTEHMGHLTPAERT